MTHKPARPRVGQLTPTALSLLFLLGCPETAELPSGTAATDSRLGGAPSVTPSDRPAPSSAPSGTPAKVALVNGPRFAVQLYATQDEAEARARKGAIDRVGLQASVVTADLGERGRWHRLLIGSYSRRDLAQLAGERLEANARVRKLLPAPAPGDPFYVVQSAPPGELAPRVATALAGLVPGGELIAAIARDHTGRPSGALVAAVGDARIRFVDAAGALQEPLPQPRYPGCRVCLTLAAAGRVRGAELLAVDDLAGDDASEALIGYRYGDGRACASLVSLGAGGEASARELGGFVLEASDANAQQVARFSFVDVDVDADAELLVEQLRAVTHEGALCEVSRAPLIYDIEAAQLRAMDESYFAALGATSARGGAQTFAKFTRVAEASSDAALIIPAAVSYLSQAGASADAEARKRFFSWLDALQGPGAVRERMGALAWLAAARPEYRASLAGKLDRALAELLLRPALGAAVAGCDEAPLARPGSWSAKPAALAKLATRSTAQADLRAVPDNVYTALASAYPVGSPIATKLDQLVERLAPASARHAVVKRAVAAARAAQAR